MSTAKDFSEKTWLIVASRLSMLLTGPGAAALVWFGSQWLDQRFSAQAVATQAVVERVKSLEDDNLPIRLSILENTILQKGAARDAQLGAITAEQFAQGSKLDKLADAVSAMNASVASLTATLRAQGAHP